ncbi:MAG TPA: DUF883 C-terminal domain-containing protein [Pirellulales bacterium]|nr:DUF883 C-terminal domain-containing protein [Pirellulales bacterium]
MLRMSHRRSGSKNPAAAVSGIAETICESGRDLRDSLQQMGCKAKNMAQVGWETARGTASDFVEKGCHKAMEVSESLETRIRTRPLRAILSAAGIGFLAGMLLKRRRP